MTNNYSIRPLKLSDAVGMLDWMTDPEVMQFFRFDSSGATIASCEAFISSAGETPNTRHYAIVNAEDEYLGTVSLKHIDTEKGEAEYAISTRSCTHGTGAAMVGTKAILEVAFEELDLKRVYLNVLADNGRANAFYRKVGFRFVRTETEAVAIRGKLMDLNWYEMGKEAFIE